MKNIRIILCLLICFSCMFVSGCQAKEEEKVLQIKSDFEGANITVLSVEDETVNVNVDLRDTIGDWFYWCFKVENAGGKTLTFKFPNTKRVGYYGAAVSYDFENWHWQYNETGHQGNSFTYTFKEDENEVYFAHDMLYRPERFEEFAKENNLKVETFCQTEKGRNVPYIDIGKGKETIFLTARHHACESTGSYVLEGVLKEIINNKAFENYRIVCVPFVDYDGVIDGDQGKNREPYDHNRDYDENIEAIYNTVSEIRKFENVKFAFDFHSPNHLGGSNDKLFIPIKSYSAVSNVTRFSTLFEKQNSDEAFKHFTKNNIMPDVGWNKAGSPTFAVFFDNKGAELAFTLETPYFMSGETAFSPEMAIETGKNFVKALKEYIGE